MPLWHVYYPKGAFSDYESKNGLVRDITKLYTDVGLPPFYVNVFFHPLDGENIWIGGVPQTPATAGGPSLKRPFIRFVAEHIAINMGDDKARNQRFMDKAIAALTPHVQDYDWEYHVDETPTELWRVQGIRPPPPGSAELKVWVKENRPVPLDEIKVTA